MKKTRFNEACTLRKGSINDGFTVDPAETLKLLLTSHLGTDPAASSGPECLLDSIISKGDYHSFQNFLTTEIMTNDLAAFKPFKAPGPDGIHPNMLKKINPLQN